ncbi:MAG TPA: hypothetical protein VI074_05980 [Propionibacteriaceae bacterium]
MLRAGPIFLGSYIFVYNLVIILRNYLDMSINRLLGGHEAQFWVRWEPVLALLQDALVEPVRLCLLAVAFRRCLELFAQRSVYPPIEVAEPEPQVPAMATAEARS